MDGANLNLCSRDVYFHYVNLFESHNNGDGEMTDSQLRNHIHIICYLQSPHEFTGYITQLARYRTCSYII